MKIKTSDDVLMQRYLLKITFIVDLRFDINRGPLHCVILWHIGVEVD